MSALPETLLIPPGKPLLVVTDLDGSLLDHHSYSCSAAEPALALLYQRGIPIVLNSSKTAAEMSEMKLKLQNQEPFVVENGGGIFIPRDGTQESITLGQDRQSLLPLLNELRDSHNFKFTGFADMSVPDLQACTGLDASSAEAALARNFTEPLLWQDTPERLLELKTLLKEYGLRLAKGGRFHHVSFPSDKGKALPWLRAWYAERFGALPHVIALGDGENDVPMLEASDTAVLLRSPVNALPQVNHQNLLIPRDEGPVGWNAAILSLCQPDNPQNQLIAETVL